MWSKKYENGHLVDHYSNQLFKSKLKVRSETVARNPRRTRRTTFGIFAITQCGKYVNLLSRKNFVKATVLFKKYIASWFHEIFDDNQSHIAFFHCHWFYDFFSWKQKEVTINCQYLTFSFIKIWFHVKSECLCINYVLYSVTSEIGLFRSHDELEFWSIIGRIWKQSGGNTILQLTNILLFKTMAYFRFI